MSGASSTTSFDQLLGELELMTKALPADEAASDDKDGDDKGGDAEAAAGGEDGDKDGKSDEQMTKSFKVTLEDGTEVEAHDGTALVKALTDRINGNEASMLKALGTAVALLKSQGEQIKQLSDTVAKLSTEGRGRKAVVTVIERPDQSQMRKSEDQGMKPHEFLAKAEKAFNAGRITGRDLIIAETHINRGSPVPANIIESVVGQ